MKKELPSHLPATPTTSSNLPVQYIELIECKSVGWVENKQIHTHTQSFSYQYSNLESSKYCPKTLRRESNDLHPVGTQ